MRKSASLILAVGLCLGVAVDAQARGKKRRNKSELFYGKKKLEVVLSPHGGFHPENRDREMTLVDGSKVKPNLNVLADDMIRRVRAGGRIEIAMYAFSDMKALASMVDRARDNVKIRLVLDACAGWTVDLRKMVYEELAKQAKLAKKEKKTFDFQVKEIPCDKFKEYGRSKVLDDGKEITGTMHEKFGVFFLSNRKMPSHSFAGSSNFAKAAATLYAENRFFFWNDPVAAAQLHEEFERLWKYWGECSFGAPCEKIGKIRNVEAGRQDVRFIFNGEPRDGGDPVNPAKVEKYRRIDWEIEQQLEKMRPDGTIDFAMFSFTHWRLKNKLLEMAAKNPKGKVRVLLDLSMMADDNPDRPGVLGPMMEKEAKERGLKNFEVRYKWRSNAHAYDPDHPEVPPGLYHFRSFLLHHKLAIVNRDRMITGSYNWSGGAERRNLENVFVLESERPAHKPAIDAFAREFDALWGAVQPEDPAWKDRFRPNPQVIPGPQGRDLQQRIIKVLLKPGAKELTEVLRSEPQSVSTWAKKAKLPKKQTQALLEALRDVTMVLKTRDGKYGLAD